MKLKFLVALSVLLSLSLNNGLASLPNGTWISASGGDFDTGSNWSNAVVPTSSVNVVFNVEPTSTPVVSIMSDHTVNNLDIIDTSVIFDLFDDNTLTVTNDTDLGLTASDIANLTLINGTLQTSNLNSGVSGTALVDIFNGATVEISSPLTVTLGLNTGSDGKLAIDGTGSQLLMGTQVGGGSEGSIIVGDAGRGTFHVHNTATPTIDASVIIGNQASSVASELVVDDQTFSGGSTLTVNDITVGNLGEGLLGVFDSSLLIADSITVGSLGSIEGDSTIRSDVDIFGEITPMSMFFGLTIDGSVDFKAGSVLNIVIFQDEGLSSNNLDIIDSNGSGDLTFSSGTLNLFISDVVPEIGDSFDVLFWEGLRTGTFGDITVDFEGLSLSPGHFFSPFYDDEFGALSLTVVPEPSTWALMGMGCLLIFWRFRRRS